MHLEVRADDAAAVPRHHGGGAARVHEGQGALRLDVVGQRLVVVVVDSIARRDLDGAESPHRRRRQQPPQEAQVRHVHVHVDRVGARAVVQHRRRQRVGGVEPHRAAAERVQHKGRRRDGCLRRAPRRLEARRLRVLEEVGQHQQLRPVARHHGRVGAHVRGQVRRGSRAVAVVRHGADLGDDGSRRVSVVVVGREVRQRHVDGAVAAGERVRAAGWVLRAPLLERRDGLGLEGGVARNFGRQRPELGVVRRRVVPGDGRARVVLQVGPDAGEVHHYGDGPAAEERRRADAAALQHRRRVERAGRDDDFAPDSDVEQAVVDQRADLDERGVRKRAVAIHDPDDLVLHEQLVVGARLNVGVVAESGVRPQPGDGVL
ncbi:hypothetical protein VTK26DRAFT_655 [Humicola hyalothermophila]